MSRRIICSQVEDPLAYCSVELTSNFVNESEISKKKKYIYNKQKHNVKLKIHHVLVLKFSEKKGIYDFKF